MANFVFGYSPSRIRFRTFLAAGNRYTSTFATGMRFDDDRMALLLRNWYSSGVHRVLSRSKTTRDGTEPTDVAVAEAEAEAGGGRGGWSIPLLLADATGPSSQRRAGMGRRGGWWHRGLRKADDPGRRMLVRRSAARRLPMEGFMVFSWHSPSGGVW